MQRCHYVDGFCETTSCRLCVFVGTSSSPSHRMATCCKSSPAPWLLSHQICIALSAHFSQLTYLLSLAERQGDSRVLASYPGDAPNLLALVSLSASASGDNCLTNHHRFAQRWRAMYQGTHHQLQSKRIDCQRIILHA
jgi:hypothetical protein